MTSEHAKPCTRLSPTQVRTLPLGAELLMLTVPNRMLRHPDADDSPEKKAR